MVAGRHTEGRTIASVGTTNTDDAITAPANSFVEEDAGRTITGTGIPASTTILSVTSGTAATLSADATATGTITATLAGTSLAAGQLYGFVGWSPETDSESEAYSLAANNAGTPVDPARLTDAVSAKAAHRARG